AVSVPRLADEEIQRIMGERKPLVLSGAFTPAEAIRRYCTYYKLPVTGNPYRSGYVQSGHYELFVQIFGPVQNKNRAYFIHGYLDHSGVNYHLVRFLLSRGYTVITIDLPGHGLSTGDHADIGSFNEYGAALQHVVRFCSDGRRYSTVIAGHSTGCAAALEYLYRTRDTDARYIFISPLVKSYLYDASLVAVSILRPFTKSIVRRPGAATSDRQFEQWIVEDPLRSESVPFGWVDALKEWNDRIVAYPPLDADLTVFQGTKDTVVDWRYSVDFLRNKIPGTDVHMVEGARHCLQYERDEVRKRFFELLAGVL
ncbi:MAG: alpha/beta hydrolase, partial [Spirochaetota bacterium]